MNNLTIFFDGKCILCFREIKHYKKLDKHHLLRTIDISASDFDASAFGLDTEEVNVNMHSIDEDGNIYIGVDTFAQIWSRVYPYSHFSFILKSKTLRPLLKFGYKVFAYKIRPRLPKRKCDNGNCELII